MSSLASQSWHLWGGQSHGGGGHAADKAVQSQAHGSKQDQVNNKFLSGNSEFGNHLHRQGKHFADGADGILKPYDHFHEEYDLHNGDHVHHIGPHDSHSYEYGDDNADFHLKHEDYSIEHKENSHSYYHEHPSINHLETHDYVKHF